jgi:hypothetical protein
MPRIMPKIRKEDNNKENKRTTKKLSLIGAAPPPPPLPTPDPPKTNIFKEIVSNVVSGFSMGVGSSLGRKAVDSIFPGSPSVSEQPIPPQKPIEINNLTKTRHLCDAYLECLKDNNNNQEFCEQFNLSKMND